MIDQKDVIQLVNPYPNAFGALAYKKHMYVLIRKNGNTKSFVKTQTFKPGLLSLVQHYVIEPRDISRNPFRKPLSLIDCDKVMMSFHLQYNPSIRTADRPDISNDLYDDILCEIKADGYKEIYVDEMTIVHNNAGVRYIR